MRKYVDNSLQIDYIITMIERDANNQTEEKKMKTKIEIVDRLTGNVVGCAIDADYKTAHDRAEKKAKRLGCGDRFELQEAA